MGLIRSYTRFSDAELHEIYMSPSYVAATRDILAHMTFDTLLDSTTIADLTEQRIRPFLNWRDENIEYLRSKFAVMAEFIIRAADLNNHVVLELS